MLMHLAVGLWTRNNYHWYLKQELRPQLSADAELTSVLWHPEKPLQLYLASPSAVQTLSRLIKRLMEPYRLGRSPYIVLANLW